MLSSLSQTAQAGRRGATVARFVRDKRGASALEFAIVATPFIALILAVMQVGYVFFANFALDGAVANGARLIRTGQVQTGGFDADKFKEEMCKALVGPLSCGKLVLDVRSYDSFASAAAGLTAPLDDKGKINAQVVFDPGSPEQVVIVRAFYTLEIASIFPSGLEFGNLGNTADGDRLLVSTAAFRNEPYL